MLFTAKFSDKTINLYIGPGLIYTCIDIWYINRFLCLLFNIVYFLAALPSYLLVVLPNYLRLVSWPGLASFALPSFCVQNLSLIFFSNLVRGPACYSSPPRSPLRPFIYLDLALPSSHQLLVSLTFSQTLIMEYILKILRSISTVADLNASYIVLYIVPYLVLYTASLSLRTLHGTETTQFSFLIYFCKVIKTFSVGSLRPLSSFWTPNLGQLNLGV